MKRHPVFLAISGLSIFPLFSQDQPISKPPIPGQADAATPVAETKPADTNQPAAPIKAEPVATSTPKEYVVKSGDNPWLIAKNHGVSLPALLKLNDIKDAKNLKVGDVLKLPEGVESQNAPTESKPVAEANKKPEEPKEGDDWELYTIQKGDNPWKIAKAKGIDHAKIIKLNEGLDFTKLDIGQQIKVPKKK